MRKWIESIMADGPKRIKKIEEEKKHQLELAIICCGRAKKRV